MPEHADDPQPVPPTAASAIAGDRAAKDALWQENRRWIAAVLLAHKPSSADLEDLLQEVAMTLVAKIHTLREESNVRAWLRAIAVNVARAAGRNSRSRASLSLSADPEHIEAIDSRTTRQNDESQHVVEAASRLPENYREPLMLRAVHGLRTRQIAEILGIEEATVDTRISRARRMLREEMEQVENNSAGATRPSRRAPAMNGQLSHNRLEVQP